MNDTLSAYAQIAVSSLSTGAVYALLLLGLLIVFRVSRAVNFAHGQLGVVAAFGSFTLADRGWMPLVPAIILGLVAAAALSYATDRFILEPITRRNGREGLDLVVTLGVLLLLTALSERLFGTSSYSYASLGTTTAVNVGPVFLNLNQVVVTALVVLALVAFAYFLSKTSAGLSMRAVASDPGLSGSMGIDVVRVRGLTWAAAGLCAGIAGVVIASRLSVDAYYMTPFLIKAVIAGILGGLDRFVAPLVIAFALAQLDGFVTYFLGSSYGTPTVFALVIVLLAVLPKRLLAEPAEARA